MKRSISANAEALAREKLELERREKAEREAREAQAREEQSRKEVEQQAEMLRFMALSSCLNDSGSSYSCSPSYSSYASPRSSPGKVYVGPRGGTYTVSPTGNKQYFGHRSSKWASMDLSCVPPFACFASSPREQAFDIQRIGVCIV